MENENKSTHADHWRDEEDYFTFLTNHARGRRRSDKKMFEPAAIEQEIKWAATPEGQAFLRKQLGR